ncbi:AAA domain-containing protein [Spiroplasma turonicum]|uniref:Uncharacterized protein n=1 Tax=Spiroplasma turonicum TaxID=216946 RepID=A0A0K1P6H9_9MOLU|nr:AAA domain-containing protein [Spiroplasma turonicum]AKU79809.1 hypothetical protein STURON_00563 [Spiroplasma turonicum]ALX70827.1 hypothetical protein STURO_v1c05610 [Spiroplasma turonicum]
MNSYDLINKFKSRLLNSNKNSGIFYNSFLPNALQFDFKKIETLGLLRKNRNDSKPISLKEALKASNFFISFYDIIVNEETLDSKGIFSYAKKLKNIILKSKHQANEKNINVLYMGTFFVEGCASTNTNDYFRSPLILRKINITDRGGFIYEVSIENEYVLNNALLNILASKNKVYWDYQELDESIISDKNLLIEKLQDYFNIIGYRLNNQEKFYDTLDYKFSSVKGLKRDEAGSIFQANYNSYFNQAFCLDLCSFGLYDIASSTILSAYNIIENDDMSFLDEMLLESTDVLNNDDIDFKENDIVTVSSLDFTQRKALVKSLKDSTYIFGPPGTGKSQVIVNLIANIINNKSDALFITEKKVASKVVYDKLNFLNKFTLMFHNNNTSLQIYKKVREMYNYIIEFKDKNTDSYETNSYSKLDEYYNNLCSFKKLFQDQLGKNYLLFLKESKDTDIESIKLSYNDLTYITEVSTILLFNKNILEDIYNLFILFNKNRININFLLSLYSEQNFNEKLYNFYIKDKLKNKIGIFNKKKFNNFLTSSEYNKLFKDTKNFLSNYNKIDIDKLCDSLNKLNLLNINNNIVTNKVLYYSYCETFKKQHIELFDFMSNDWFHLIGRTIDEKCKNDKDIIIFNYFKYIIENIQLGRYIDSKTNTGKNLSTLFNELGKNIRKTKTSMRLTTLFKNYSQLMKLFFPILIGSPETISDHKTIPLIKKEYEYAIFDEASQIFTEKCIPILYRAKKYIICGDDKQLAPTNFFKIKNDVIDEEEVDEVDVSSINYELQEALKYDSLLSFANGRFQTSMLQYHYRSKSKQLIDFSNAKYYENKLIISNQMKSISYPIELIEVDGIRKDKKNIKEAEVIIELINFILSNKKLKEKSIGIITFNTQQQDLIQDLLEKESINNPELSLKLLNKEPGEELFVKSIENVQGDERDIIIFSICFAKDETGVFKNYFGPIAQENGEKRLNVAISRAKEKMYVIKSIPSSIINSDKRGVLDFKEFLKYCELLTSPTTNKDQINLLLNKETNQIKFDNLNKINEFDSEFEVEVYDAINQIINKERYELKTQVPASGFKIDICIYDKLKKQFILAIECDGYTFHSSTFSKVNDYERQRYLENRGWVFLRILSNDWWNKNNSIVKTRFLNNIKKHLKNNEIEEM